MYSERLKQELEKQKTQNILNLNDKVLDEQSCQLISEFLRENTQYTQFSAKGSQITPRGFIKLCEGLKKNLKLNSLLLEWNQIGDSVQGLQALQDLLQENTSIQIIDLKNNNIRQDGAKILAEIIGLNCNVTSLDLKWNEIGVKGGEQIVDAMQNNNKLKKVDISCNKVPEEMIQEVNRVLYRNKQGVSTLEQSLKQQQTLQFQPRLNQSFGETNQFLNETTKNQLKATQKKDEQLNEILNLERARVKELKIKLEKELEEENRIRVNLQETYGKLKAKVQEKENLISELDITYKNMTNENEILRIDINEMNNEICNMKQQTTESSCDLENQLKQSVQDIQVLERQHFQEQDQIMSDHEVYVKNMLVDFQMRYDALNNRLKQVKLQKNEMEDKANMIQENMMKSQIDHFEQYRNLKGKLGDEERRKYDENLKQLEQRLAVAKELKEKTIRKNEDLLKEIEYKEKKVYEQISDSFGHGYQVEINNLREKINNLHKELSVYNLDIDGHKYKHIQIESKIDFLEEELAEKNRDLMRLKDYNRDQIDFKNVQHNYQRRGYKDSTEQLHRRICDLDNALRLQNKENEAIKTEYDRICHTLQHSINRCLAETLSSRSIVDIKNKPMELPKPPLMPAQLNQQSLPPINRLPNPSKERRQPHFHPQNQHHQQQQNYQEIHQYSAPRQQQQQAPIEVRPLRHSFSTLQQPLQQQTIIEHRQPINQQIIHHSHNNNHQLQQQQHGFSLSPGRRQQQQQQYLVQPQFQQHQQIVRSYSPRQVFTQQGNQVIKSQSPVILSPNQYQQQQQQVIIRRSLSPTQVAGQPSQIIRRASPTQQIGNVVQQQPVQRVINSSVSPSGRKTSSLVRQLQQQQSPTILRSPIQQGVQRSSQQYQVHQQVQQTQNREQQNQEQNQQQNQNNQNQHQEN